MIAKTVLSTLFALILLVLFTSLAYSELSDKEFLQAFSQALSSKGDRGGKVRELVENNPQAARRVLSTLKQIQRGTGPASDDAKNKASILSTAIDLTPTKGQDLDLLHKEAQEAFNKSSYDVAMAKWLNALQVATEEGYIPRIIFFRCKTAMVYSKIGDFDSAIKSYQDGLGLCDRIGARKSKAAILQEMGKIYDIIGDRETALKCYEDSKQITSEAVKKKE